MTGGLIQLVAYGKEDLFLTRDPQITYFKITYKRHTNFSKEDVPHRFLTEPNFGEIFSTIIPKDADIINNATLKLTIPEINNDNDIIEYAWVKKLGFAIIDYIEISIDGKVIDKHYGEWMNIWSELTTNNIEENSIDKLIGNIPELFTFSKNKPSYTLYIPIYLWFCRNSGLGLPIVALQFSDIRINIKFHKLNDVLLSTPNKYIQCGTNDVCFKKYEIIKQKQSNNIHTNDYNYGLFHSYDTFNKRLYYLSLNNDFSITTENNDNNIFEWINSKIENYGGFDNDKKIYANEIIGLETKFTVLPDSNSTTVKNDIDLNITDCLLLLDYVYLDNEERLYFTKTKHDYLIEKVYFTPSQDIISHNERFRLNINGPCKLTVFLSQLDNIKKFDKFNYTDFFDFNYLNINSINNINDTIINNRNNNSLFITNRILLNSQERVSKRDSAYFEYIQPYQNSKNRLPNGVGMYSYALHPTKVIPSGTSNMTEIEYIDLETNLSNVINKNNPAKFRSYSLCYQVWRVSLGLSGELFIN